MLVRSDFAAMLRDLRRQAEWTQKYLADLIGVTAGYISLLERGMRCPSTQVVLLMVKAFNLEGEARLQFINEALEANLLESNKGTRTWVNRLNMVWDYLTGEQQLEGNETIRAFLLIRCKREFDSA